MPKSWLIGNRKSLALSKVEGLIGRNLLYTFLFTLSTFFLSGCSAIGYSKPAALQVTSTPEASVFLDGKHLGKTPFYSDQFESGDHTLKISASDAKYVSQIQLTQGTLTVVNRELATNFIAQAGEVLSLKQNATGFMIVSWPNEADLTIDGRYFGKTPALISEIENGDNKVLVSKQGYVSREFAIKTSSQFQVVAEVTLASEIAKGLNGAPKEATQEAE